MHARMHARTHARMHARTHAHNTHIHLKYTCVDGDKEDIGDDDVEEIDGTGYDNEEDNSNAGDAEETEETIQDRDLAADATEENNDTENSDEVIVMISIHVIITVYFIRYNLIGSLISLKCPQGTTNKLLMMTVPPLMLHLRR